MTLGAGEVFAGYSVVRLLGRGGMGEVYLAQHPRLPRREALKILRPELSADETFRRRFIREADSIAALEHPHIVTVHDRGETEGLLWIATRYVDGNDAAQLMRDRYPAGMPAGEVAAVTSAIADALDYAHDRGLLHRDVKPANFLLTEPDRDGGRRTYLADFGIARPLDDSAGLTATNFTLGTVAYAAPEQLMGRALDGRADQYALAASTFHLLTGVPVFPDSNPVVVISQHLTQPPRMPSAIRPELVALDSVFVRALAKDPEDRFSYCSDFAHAIATAVTRSGVDDGSTAATQQAPVAAVPSFRAARWRSPQWATIAAGAVIAFVAAGALLWRPWAQQREAPDSTPTSAGPTNTLSLTPTTTASALSTPSPPVTTSPPLPTMTQTPQRPNYPPAGALGSACPPPGGAIGTGPDGAIYYCARRQYTDSYEWSLTPGDIPNPLPPLDIPPGSPCMVPGGSAETVSGTLYCKPTPYGGWAWQY